MHSHDAAVLTHIGLSLWFCTIQTLQQFVVAHYLMSNMDSSRQRKTTDSVDPSHQITAGFLKFFQPNYRAATVNQKPVVYPTNSFPRQH